MAGAPPPQLVVSPALAAYVHNMVEAMFDHKISANSFKINARHALYMYRIRQTDACLASPQKL